MLVSLLVLATGIASGLVMLISLGWLSIGIVAMRPARPDPAWHEWFKLPVLFFFCMPVWMDLAGSRHDWLQWLGGRSAAAPDDASGILALMQLQLVARACLVVLLLSVPGALFWFLIPTIPIALFFGIRCAELVRFGTVWLGQIAGSIIAPVVVWLLGVLFGRIRLDIPSLRRAWAVLAARAFGRFPAPWLAGIVIILQQTSLAEGWLASINPHFNLPGGVILLVALLWIRRSDTPGGLHLNSRLGLSAALFVLLAAEWTDLNPLRHMALGILVICAALWGCAWSWPTYLFALGAWLALLPATQVLLVRAGSSPGLSVAAAWLLFTICLGALAGVTLIRRPEVMVRYYPDSAWQPVKRFSFILTALLVGFQIMSAFWPPSDRPESGRFLGISTTISRWPLAGALADGERVRRWTMAWQNHRVDLAVMVPPDLPVRLYAPELLFTSAGWKIGARRLVPHANGQMVELYLENQGRSGCALYWFQNTDRAFVHYLRARHVLWSGWNLARRDLRLVVAFSDQIAMPEQLQELAEADGWFTRELAATTGEPGR